MSSLREKKSSTGLNVAKTILKVFLRTLAVIGVTVLLVLILVIGACFLAMHGPSPAFRSQFAMFAYETSALKWLPKLFLGNDEFERIIAENTMPEAADGTASNTDLIQIPAETVADESVPPIVIEEINGGTYHGYMMIIQDPSTVFVGTVDQFRQGDGDVVKKFCERYNAIGGVNGGEFVDMGSYSYTACPVGGVISQGQALYENNDVGKWNLVCLTFDNKLILLKGYSVAQALALNVRDAVHVKHETGPFLIIDGEPLEVPSVDVYGGGKNPRTAIGQRADGAILMCVIDGRQASSLGATFKEMIDIMQDYGAINAACLDGGTSTQMEYNGITVNNPYSPTGPRRCPTAFLIMSTEANTSYDALALMNGEGN
ncbi:MAG: phosphodiester glycosidase family protein [Lachnospiraceae bacterium]|nr:phosphodiester glycosidase family protein [Lachnospiraceae bacterium]